MYQLEYFEWFKFVKGPSIQLNLKTSVFIYNSILFLMQQVIWDRATEAAILTNPCCTSCKGM